MQKVTPGLIISASLQEMNKCRTEDFENGNDDNEEYDYENDIASLNKKGELVFHALRKNKIACSNFVEILASAIESKKLLEEQEETIDMLQKNEREAADEIGALSQALEESGSSSEESYNIAISNLTKERDHALAMVKVLKKEKIKFDEDIPTITPSPIDTEELPVAAKNKSNDEIRIGPITRARAKLLDRKSVV